MSTLAKLFGSFLRGTIPWIPPVCSRNDRIVRVLQLDPPMTQHLNFLELNHDHSTNVWCRSVGGSDRRESAAVMLELA